MIETKTVRTIATLVACLVQIAGSRAADEIVTIYPTYGYQEPAGWVIPMRLWVHERRDVAESAARKIAAEFKDTAPEELRHFRSRIADFLADSESREVVSFEFDRDPDSQQFQLCDSGGHPLKSDLNGLIEGSLRLTYQQADRLLIAQGATHRWLSVRVTSNGHSGTGKVQLIAPDGISVISDIDDTIKVTEIPAGPEIVVANTFLRDYRVAQEMVTRYREWSEAAFHYVSGGPWQMYDPLSEFLIDGEAGFPEGSFHMQNAPTNLFSRDSWKSLTNIVTNSKHTYEHKVTQITLLMERFPRRQFILVGDSGEKDPEVYRAIRETFPQQVRDIWIRDVVNDRELNPDRLSTMNVIPAATVKEGISEFE